MDKTVVKNSIGSLDQLLSRAKSALSQIEQDRFGLVDDSDTGGFVDPKAALGDTLEELHDILLVVLEAAEMPEAKASMIEEWPTFTSAKDGLSHVEVDTEFDYCASPALIFVKRLIEALRMSVSKQISSEEAWTLRDWRPCLRIRLDWCIDGRSPLKTSRTFRQSCTITWAPVFPIFAKTLKSADR